MADGTAASDLLRRLNSLDAAIFNIDFKDLENVKTIGSGNFGQVSKGLYLGTEVAIKQLLDVDDRDMHKYIEREMSNLRELRHPNVVQFMGLCRHGTEVFIVTEYIPGGDLRHILKDKNRNLSWLLRAKISLDCAQAMAFLHSKGLIHRDLKSNNLLVGDNWKIKVCDFGFSRKVSKGEIMTLCGTDEWMAPEVMCGDKYDEKADIFSFAMVLTEIVTRKKPALRKPAKGFRFELEPFLARISPDTPPEFVRLINECAEQQPERRPAFKDILPRLRTLVSDLEAKETQALQAAQTALSNSGNREKEKKKKKSNEKKKKKENNANANANHNHNHNHTSNDDPKKKKKKERDPNETPEERAKRREERAKRRAEREARKKAKENEQQKH
eukprot:TRINITY_DN1278_c1_g3_i1.p1 TRINITY_DN1278_c1_g3~~TRINITY_DN1278_c1_g3_i1.p1  ORF type:complete len:386 (-),score=196.22 TRINITY_DN1278_c1_g3_i1:17-1174(-)